MECVVWAIVLLYIQKSACVGGDIQYVIHLSCGVSL